MKLQNFIGMNNRAAEHSLPPDKLRCANNIYFDNQNKMIFPRPGKYLIYTGNCHSLFQSPFVTLFVEDGILKRLNADVSVTSLEYNVGDDPVNYSVVGDQLFFANANESGRLVSPYTTVSEWGCERPALQPDCEAIAVGGMYSGEYHVAITWIGTHEESGTVSSAFVTVEEGGGIRLTNFPSPPSYVTAVAVYVSSVNGKDLYLYGEYPANTSTLDLSRLDDEGDMPAEPLKTQFMYPPLPEGLQVVHYGSIYYAIDNLLYWTEPHLYGLQKSGNYWTFDSAIQTVVSCPNVLYVGTETQIYKITNIGGEEPSINEVLQNCGTVKGSECNDPDGVASYFMSARGFIKATPQGLEEISYENVAIPFYAFGSMMVVEKFGLKHLVFVGSNPTINPLQEASYTTDYPVLPTAWYMNLTTGAISNGSLTANSVDANLCSDATGLHRLSDISDNGTVINCTAQTGNMDFDDPYQKRISDCYVSKRGGKMQLKLETENSSISYPVRANTKTENVKLDLARGSKGRYWQFTLSSSTLDGDVVDGLEFEIVKLSRKV